MTQGSGQPPVDPITMWREWAQKAEEQWNQYFNQVMGTETFAAMMGRSMESMLAVQTKLAEQFEQTLKAWNLPTRGDLIALGERLNEIEERLDQITELIEAQQGPARTGRRGGDA